MGINYTAVLIATVAQFIAGAIWYGPLFGRLWGKIHGFDKLPKAVQAKMVKEMGPFYAIQFVVTVLTSLALFILVELLPEFSPFMIALLIWIGFVVPANVSAVIFGGTEGKWVTKKIAVMAGATFVCLVSGAFVFSLFA